MQQPQMKEAYPPQFLQFKKEYDEFKQFVRNSLLSLRKELENVLFACFLQLLRLGNEKKDDFQERFKMFRNIVDSNKNMFISPRLLKEVMMISSSLTLDNFATCFPELLEKLTVNGKNVVFLSEFAYECLFSYFEIEKKSAIMNSLNSFLTIRILKDPVAEANFKNEFLKLAGVEDLEKMSAGVVQTLPSKADFDFYMALDSMSRKRVINEKAKKYKVNPQDVSFITDGLKGLGNFQGEGSSILPIPEVKLASRVTFAQNYMDRVPLCEEVQPSILQVTLSDPQENLTCVEIGLNCNVLLYGSLDSSISLYLLNPDFLEDLRPKDKEPIVKEEQEQSPIFYYKFLGHSSAVTSLSLLYDELFFLSSSVDTTIRLWCIRSRSCLVQYQAHINTVWRVRFSSKGYYFASASSDSTAKLWTLDRLSPIRLFLGHSSDVMLVDFLHNLQFLVTSSLDNRIIFWEIASGTKVRVLFHYQETVTSISISPSGLFMVTGSEDGSVIFWDLAKFLRVNCWEFEGGNMIRTKNEIKQKILFSGFAIDESYVMVGSRKKVALYLVKNLRERRNEDIYKELKEEEEEKEKVDNFCSLEKNSFDNQGNDFFLTARFHEKNHVFLVSKSLV